MESLEHAVKQQLTQMRYGPVKSFSYVRGKIHHYDLCEVLWARYEAQAAKKEEMKRAA